MRTLALFLALMTASLICRAASASGYAPKVGQRHPDFTLPAISGRAPVSLSHFHGKKVLLIQFASW